jgi:hypothetical protein
MYSLKAFVWSFTAILAVNAQLVAAEPRLTSLYPLGGKQGTSFEVAVRGENLEGVRTIWFDCDKINAEMRTVLKADDDLSKSAPEGKPTNAQQLAIKVTIDGSAAIGAHAFRVISAFGISNPLWLEVNAEDSLQQGQLSPSTEGELAVPRIPIVINGRIREAGEYDHYTFKAEKGELVKFEALTGIRGWPPVLALYEPVSTWLNSHDRIKLAVNDEGIFFLPQLSYRFEKGGRYIIEVGTINGRGGPEYAYQLRTVHAVPQAREGEKWQPQALAHSDLTEWQERSFTRPIAKNQLQTLWARTIPQGARAQTSPAGSNPARSLAKEDDAGRHEQRTQTGVIHIPELSAVIEHEPNDTGEQATEFPVPGLLEGVIEKPGDVDLFKFRVDVPETLVFEIETPDTPPLRFNPRLAVVDQQGKELLNNIYREVGGSGDEWAKSFEPKTVYKFDRTGEYFLEVRDATTRNGDSHFSYRVLVRPEIPHMGEITVQGVDHINLAPGETRKISISTGREEGFEGEIALMLDPLPPGVQAFTATQVEHQSGRPGASLVGGQIHPERFRSEVQTVAIVLLAGKDAPLTASPLWARLIARPIAGSTPGTEHVIRTIPIMVVRSSKESAAR